MKKLIVIGFIIIAFFALSAKPSFAAGKAWGQNKNSTTILNIQGKSSSDPDNNGKGPERSNGGMDKPGYTGGINNDRDGNNGCGNDTDREDDNEGWCGLKPKVSHQPKPCSCKVEEHKEKDCDKTCEEDHDKGKEKCEKTCETKDNDHNKCEKSCVCPAPKPTPNPIGTPVAVPVTAPLVITPVTSKPAVLGISTLPNTATESKPNYDLLIVWILLISGIELHLLANRLKATAK